MPPRVGSDALGGELMAVKLAEVVGHHPDETHLRS
jgi:hypothetical protein